MFGDDFDSIKKIVVEDQVPGLAEEKLSNTHYVQARFDMIKESAVNKIDEKKSLGKNIIKNKIDRHENNDNNNSDNVITYKTADEIWQRNLLRLEDESEKRYMELNSEEN